MLQVEYHDISLLQSVLVVFNRNFIYYYYSLPHFSQFSRAYSLETVDLAAWFTFISINIVNMIVHNCVLSIVGKNDGTVQGKRYFICKKNYGLFVKPEKASHRGIKCSKLLPKKL